MPGEVVPLFLFSFNLSVLYVCEAAGMVNIFIAPLSSLCNFFFFVICFSIVLICFMLNVCKYFFEYIKKNNVSWSEL